MTCLSLKRPVHRQSVPVILGILLLPHAPHLDFRRWRFANDSTPYSLQNRPGLSAVLLKQSPYIETSDVIKDKECMLGRFWAFTRLYRPVDLVRCETGCSRKGWYDVCSIRSYRQDGAKKSASDAAAASCPYLSRRKKSVPTVSLWLVVGGDTVTRIPVRS